ncbi:MAG: hypothetical protein HQL56_00495 [Magnetococcales bacterium]|nr:hypothetical protein [Magnetococcales bacterium]
MDNYSVQPPEPAPQAPDKALYTIKTAISIEIRRRMKEQAALDPADK